MYCLEVIINTYLLKICSQALETLDIDLWEAIFAFKNLKKNNICLWNIIPAKNFEF